MPDDGPVRVLRLIEILYPSREAYEVDRAHWALPANGERQFGPAGPVYKTIVTTLAVSPGDERHDHDH